MAFKLTRPQIDERKRKLKFQWQIIMLILSLIFYALIATGGVINAIKTQNIPDLLIYIGMLALYLIIGNLTGRFIASVIAMFKPRQKKPKNIQPPSDMNDTQEIP